MFYYGPRAFRHIFMFNWMCTNHWIFRDFTMTRAHFEALPCPIVCAQCARFPLFYNGPRAFRCIFMARRHCACMCMASTRGKVCTRCTHASTHVQRTISMRLRWRTVTFVTFNAFAHMLSKCVFIAHSGVCHELNWLIWVCGM